MLQVLQDWEKQSAKVQKLYGDIHRIVYDSVFMTEKRAKGTFYFSGPDRGAFRVEGVRPQSPVGTRKNAQGQPYTPKADDPEHWICTGKEVLKFDHVQKMYEIFVIPPENRGTAIMDTPLPFLLGMKVDQARLRYKMKLLKSPNPDTYMIEVLPRMQKDIANYRIAIVMLDKATFLPSAVKMIDPTGNKETVLVFKNIEQNKQPRNALFQPIDPSDPREYAKYKRSELQDRGSAPPPPQARRDPKQPVDGLGAADRR